MMQATALTTNILDIAWATAWVWTDTSGLIWFAGTR